MVLGISELLRLVKEQNLVENLSERELTNPEGAGFDIRIGALYRLQGEGFLGIGERETPEMEIVAEYNPRHREIATLEPKICYVMKTIERVNTPLDVAILFRPRSTLYRSGIALFTGNTSPGYKGELHFGIVNLRDKPFSLELGARVAHAMFYRVEGGGAQYRGQWQGGRTATEGREAQI